MSWFLCKRNWISRESSGYNVSGTYINFLSFSFEIFQTFKKNISNIQKKYFKHSTTKNCLPAVKVVSASDPPRMPSQLTIQLNSTPGARLKYITRCKTPVFHFFITVWIKFAQSQNLWLHLEMHRSKVSQHPVFLTTDHHTASHLVCKNIFVFNIFVFEHFCVWTFFVFQHFLCFNIFCVWTFLFVRQKHWNPAGNMIRTMLRWPLFGDKTATVCDNAA